MKTKSIIAAALLGLFLGNGPLMALEETASKASQIKPVKAKKATKAGKANSAKTVSLSVTEEGFVPALVKIKKGEAYDLVVTRQTDQTCARQIVIPGYGISKELPLNTPVKIRLVPKATGNIQYSCSMDMIRGVLTVE